VEARVATRNTTAQEAERPCPRTTRKGGGPRRGGERGPRTGPALGGEAGSVLSESLSALGSGIDYQARIQRQPMELQHMPHDHEQMYRRKSILAGCFISM
jgi:hypothetical protein